MKKQKVEIHVNNQHYGMMKLTDAYDVSFG